MEEGWLMEAVTIQESIFSGRILSALQKKGIDVDPKDSFSSLIDRFRRHFEQDDEGMFAYLPRTVDVTNERACVEHILYRYFYVDPDPTRN